LAKNRIQFTSMVAAAVVETSMIVGVSNEIEAAFSRTQSQTVWAPVSTPTTTTLTTLTTRLATQTMSCSDTNFFAINCFRAGIVMSVLVFSPNRLELARISR